MNADFDQTISLTAILMDATVTWNQTGQGFIDMGRQQIATYAGDAIIAEWPKPLQRSRRRLHRGAANAVDSNGVNGITNANGTYRCPGPTRRRSIPTATS
jgi:radical SAM superfamily enzyme with C-terminal helix-hairpin-helix motif